jgi:hypothetical protein
MSGWLIRISGWEKPEAIRLFAAAESDPRAALVAVHTATNALPNEKRIETVGPLSSHTIQKLGLEPGRVLNLTD